jgi:hypothetical protein
VAAGAARRKAMFARSHVHEVRLSGSLMKTLILDIFSKSAKISYDEFNSIDRAAPRVIRKRIRTMKCA